MYKKILFYSFLIFFLLFSITPTQSKVSNGFIDLKNYNFSKNGPLNLDGEWSFYWNTFLNPTDLKNKDLEKQKISAKIPGSWVTGKTGHLPNLGHGTYLLKVKGLVKNKDMSLSLKDIPSAFKVFIVQKQIVKEIGGKGQVSPTKKGSRPQYGSFIGDFQVNENSFFILIHVSNYHHRIGGLNDIPKLGLKDDIHKQAKTKHYQFFFVLGLFLMMGVNHFSIFFQRREDKGSLWFGLFCFTLMLRSLSIESYFEFLFSNPSNLAFQINYKLRYLTFFLLGPIFFSFLKFLFKDQISSLLLKWYWRISITASAIVIITPVHIYTHLTSIFQVLILLSGIYLLIQITKAMINKVTYARICLAGIIFLVIGVIWDIMVSRKLITAPNITPFTTSFFIFIQSYIISRKFSLAFNLAEKLNIELEDKVIKRTKEIATLLNNLESSIFSVKKDLKVTPPFSQYSETLFKKNIDGQNIFDFLFIPIEKESRKYKEMILNFESVFGDDELQYSFVEGNFLQNITLSDTDRPEGRSLKISYNPIFDQNGLVERLMFIVEDITEFEKFYQEAKSDQLSYNFIKEVLTIDNKKGLVNSLNKSITSGIESLEDLLSQRPEIIKNNYFLQSYKTTVEKITKDVESMPLLNQKIHVKTADFDYVSLLGEQDYGQKKVEENFNYQLEVTDKINDIVEYLLIYGNVVKLFYPVKFDFPFGQIIEEKIINLKSQLSFIFENTFQVKDTEGINKETLAKIAQLAKVHPGFDQFMHLIQQRAKFISLLLRANEKEEASKTFSTLANLFKRMPPQEKLNETDLNQNLIIPFKEMKKMSLGVNPTS